MRFNTLLAAFALTVAAGAAAEEATIVRPGLGERLDGHLRAMEQDGFSGTCLIAVDGEVVLAQGYGWANREERIPVTVDTVFDIGSITKQFTGAAILKLEEQGKLSVTDPVTKYFDAVPDDRRETTLHHLLTHSAWLPPSVGGDYEEMSAETIIERGFQMPLRYEPGERYRYSNVGYSYLGIIIERLTGKSYEAYLREVFFDPVGMNDTGYVLPEWGPNQLAHGYYNNNDWGSPKDQFWDDDGPYWNLRANGGILSNVWDMYRWHRALLDDTVLTDASREKLFKPHINEGPGVKTSYGYGWSIQPTPRDTTLIAHNGGNGIFFADFWRYIDEDAVLIIMTNAVQHFDETGFRHMIEELVKTFEARAKE